MTTSLLIYDIPTSSGIANPTRRLRRLGVRVNLSCWVLPTENVPHQLLDSLGQSGATWHCVPFTHADSDALRAMVVAQMTQEVNRLTKSLETSAAKFATGLEGDLMTPEALMAFRRKTQQALRRAERILNDSLQGAAALGVTADALPVEVARERAEAVKAAAQTKAHLYAQAIERLRDETLRTAATQDAVPACVIADALEDEGQDAGDLRNAFAVAG